MVMVWLCRKSALAVFVVVGLAVVATTVHGVGAVSVAPVHWQDGSRHPNVSPSPPYIPNDGHPFPLPGHKANDHCWLPKYVGSETCAPEFVIPGSMKCGTTSMFSYLMRHPKVGEVRKKSQAVGLDSGFSKPVSIQPLADKEVRFFMSNSYHANVRKGGLLTANTAYLRLFPDIQPTAPGEVQAISGESSPMYVCGLDNAYLTYRLLPEAKMIFLLRNPADRAWSEFWFTKGLAGKGVGENEAERNSTPHLSVTWPEGNIYERLNREFPDRKWPDATVEFMAKTSAEAVYIENCYYKEWDPYAEFYGGQRDPALEVDNLFRCFRAQAGRHQAALKAKQAAGKAHAEDTGDCRPGGSFHAVCSDTRRGGTNIHNGLYFPQLVPWLQLYPTKNIMVVRSEDFYNDTAKVMEEVTAFLGLQPVNWEPITNKAFNIMSSTSATKQHAHLQHQNKGLGMGIQDHNDVSQYAELPEPVRQCLVDWLDVYNQKLQQLLRLDRPMWTPSMARGE